MRHLLDCCRLVLYDISASYRGWIEDQKQSITYCRLVVLHKRMMPCSLGNPHSFRDIWSHQHMDLYTTRREVLAAQLLVVLRVWAPLKVALGGWKMFTILKETWGWKHNQKHIYLHRYLKTFAANYWWNLFGGTTFLLIFFCWRRKSFGSRFPVDFSRGAAAGETGPRCLRVRRREGGRPPLRCTRCQRDLCTEVPRNVKKYSNLTYNWHMIDINWYMIHWFIYYLFLLFWVDSLWSVGVRSFFERDEVLQILQYGLGCCALPVSATLLSIIS